MSISKKDIATELCCNKIEAAVGRKLANLYKGYQWYIECKWQAGVVEIKNLTIHGDYGFVLYLKELLTDINLDVVMRAGGELLERCGLPTTHRPENLNELVERDIRGNVIIGDTHGAS